VTAALGDGGRVFFIKVLSVLDTSGGKFCEKICATLANDGRILPPWPTVVWPTMVGVYSVLYDRS
jgi:hypothetical protein